MYFAVDTFVGFVSLRLCLLTDINFRKLMSKQAEKQGIESDTDLYWWHGRLIKEIMECSNWYAPRIKFLEDWKKELLDDVL